MRAPAHALFEAMSGAARQLTAPAPLVYTKLTGTFGLATDDPAFQALAAAAVGGVSPGVKLS